MVNDANWLLPEGVEEILPDEALKLEYLRREVIDDLTQRQFKLVMPPVMEFVDSLLTGTGEELDTQTYKFMDQHTQRMLGIRADITPQVARLDSHYLSDNDVNRLCYAGTVLRTQPARMGEQRELLQVGAELFGVEEVTGDIEIIDAMMAMLKIAKVEDITLSVGHVGLYRALLKDQSIGEDLEQRLRDVMLRKSRPDLDAMSSELNSDLFNTLLSMEGSASVINTAQLELGHLPSVAESLDELQQFANHVQSMKGVNLHIDLADVAGYRYHTGLLFTAFVSGRGRSIAQGGRYDRIGQQFGRARAATGFSADLKTLVKI